MDKIKEITNTLRLSGIILTDLEFNHEILHEKFYNFYLRTERKKGVVDDVRVIISERIFYGIQLKKGDFVTVQGELRSYNQYGHVMLFAFAQDLVINKDLINENSVVLVGYICKDVYYKAMPSGRQIADIILAVGRSYNKSDYIPCSALGKNSKRLSTLSIGTKLKIEGRFQSRAFFKMENDNLVEKVAYELYIKTLEILELSEKVNS